MSEDITRSILNLELELLQTDTRQSAQRLSELIADDFREFGESGKRYGKIDVLQALPESTPPSFIVKVKALVEALGEEYADYSASTKRLVPGVF
jgi:hypothetical protein